MHFLQDLDERRRIQSQTSIYLQQNPEHANLTIGNLREMTDSRDKTASFMLNRVMNRYGVNKLGSVPYMALEKRNLMALME